MHTHLQSSVCSTAARHTCPRPHSHRAVLLSSAPDPQLAEAVPPPAPEAAAARHSARVFASRGDGGDGDACRRGGGCAEYQSWMEWASLLTDDCGRCARGFAPLTESRAFSTQGTERMAKPVRG